MDEATRRICPFCHQPVLPEYYFCPNCGHALQEKPEPVPFALQLGIYTLSLFVPPLGFWPGFKYVMKQNPQAKRVGWIAICLTLLSTILSIWAIFSLSQNYLSQINSVMN